MLEKKTISTTPFLKAETRSSQSDYLNLESVRDLRSGNIYFFSLYLRTLRTTGTTSAQNVKFCTPHSYNERIRGKIYVDSSVVVGKIKQEGPTGILEW